MSAQNYFELCDCGRDCNCVDPSLPFYRNCTQKTGAVHWSICDPSIKVHGEWGEVELKTAKMIHSAAMSEWWDTNNTENTENIDPYAVVFKETVCHIFCAHSGYTRMHEIRVDNSDGIRYYDLLRSIPKNNRYKLMGINVGKRDSAIVLTLLRIKI